MLKPSLDEFKKLASLAARTGGNLVPVCRQVLADTLTPVSAFQALVSSGATSGATKEGGGADTAFLL